MTAAAPRVLAFADSQDQAQRLAAELGLACASIEVHRFPDGESRLRLPPALPAHIILVRSFDTPNDKLVELELAAASARANGVERITLVAPYLCYMRQDTAFHAGEAVSQRIIGEWLAARVDALVTVDPHLHRITRLDQAVPLAEAITVTAADLLGEYVATRLQRPLLLGPDVESRQWVERAAAAAETDHCVAAKTRHGDRMLRIELPEFDFHDREVVLMDDIASTGQTLIEAATALYARGARRVDAAVTHPLFLGAAQQRLHAAGVRELWSTDSIPHATNRISLARRLAEALTGNALISP